MYFVKRHLDFRTINAIVRCYSLTKRSHYEVLNLRRNCTDKEIKDAFIHMSKAYHPDKNKDVKAQEHFVRIVEAYNVLSKPGARAQYDTTIDYESASRSYRPHYDTYSYSYRYPPPPHYHTHYETSSKKTRHQKETREKDKSNYGVSGFRKMPNYIIIMLCFGIAIVGTMMQIIIIRELYVVHRRQALERSRYLAEELEKVRAAAQGNSNDIQTRLLLEKIVAAANPTVATASLGQALANEKKMSSESLLTEFGVAEIIDDINVNYVNNNRNKPFKVNEL